MDKKQSSGNSGQSNTRVGQTIGGQLIRSKPIDIPVAMGTGNVSHPYPALYQYWYQKTSDSNTCGKTYRK